MKQGRELIAALRDGHRPSDEDAMGLAAITDLAPLLEAAEALALDGHGRRVSYSRKVFIPLTQLCRDVCHYCTFAQAPKRGQRAYLSPDEVLAIARAGREAGCKEALFTLGDKPELRYRAARETLEALGHDTTLSYLEAMARLVLEETGLLPHLNPGVMSASEMARLRPVSASMGLMLESAAARLSDKGGPHWGSPDKQPAVRLATLEAAGVLKVPFTTGLLIGIGETRAERVESLLALRGLHARHGHLQEIIIQNFRAKPGTRMAEAPEPSLEDQLWTIAVTRLLFGPAMNIQAPPNLQPAGEGALLRAGINDWGGVSPVTPDHVNPEAPWPHLDDLARRTAQQGRTLVERLAIYPGYLRAPETWLDRGLRRPVLQLVDGEGLARDDRWKAGAPGPVPAVHGGPGRPGREVTRILAGAPRPQGFRPAPGAQRRIAFKTGTSYGFRDAWALGFDDRYTVAVWLGRPDGTPSPGRFGLGTAAPLLFEVFGQLPPPEPQDRRGTDLRTAAEDLPPGLRRLRPRGEVLADATAPSAPRIVFPLDDSLLVLPPEGGVQLQAAGGRGPYTWLVDGRPLGRMSRRKTASWRPTGPGFAKITLIDSRGRRDQTLVRVQAAEALE